VEAQGGYICDIVYWSEAPDAQAKWRELTARVRADILPQVSAADVEPAPNLD